MSSRNTHNIHYVVIALPGLDELLAENKKTMHLQGKYIVFKLLFIFKSSILYMYTYLVYI